MASKKSRAAKSSGKRLFRIAPGVYSDDPRDLKDAREWERRDGKRRSGKNG
jgi:hypothetical protein